jgi:hypothetical protein
MTELTDLTTVRTALFVKISVTEYAQPSGFFAPETLRFSDHDSNFELTPGETYTALGQLMNVTSTVRELTPTSSTVNVQISGIPNSSLNQINSSKFKGSPVVITRGFFNPDGTPFVEFDRELASITRIGQAVLSDDELIFGTTSLRIPNAESGVSATPIDLGLSDFTIEGWFRVTDAASLTESYIFDARNAGVNLRRPYLQIIDSRLVLVAGPGSSGEIVLAESAEIDLDEWYYVAVVRRFDEFKLFLNGTQQGPARKDTAFRTKVDMGTGALFIGTRHALDQSNSRRSMIGFMDEFRVSKVARYWLEDFSQVPQFNNDRNTLLFLRFDGINGSTIFLDDNTPIDATKTVGKFRGFINNIIFQEDWDVERRMSTLTVNFDCSSTVELLSRKKGGRRTNPESMRKFFPGDKSFDRVPAIVNANINFGGTTS